MLKIYFMAVFVLLHTFAHSQSYCTLTSALGEADQYFYLKNFKLGSIDNPTGWNGYQDFTHLSTDLVIGQHYGFQLLIPVKAGLSSRPMSRIYIWLDWNQDGVFDATEKVIDYQHYLEMYYLPLDVPATAPLGKTRMRVKVSYTDPNSDTEKDPTYKDPCGISLRTDVEDYTVNVISCNNIKTTPDLSYTCGETSFLEAINTTTAPTSYSWSSTTIQNQPVNTASIWVGNWEDATYKVTTVACNRTVEKNVSVTVTKINAPGATVACGDYAHLSASSNYPDADFIWTGPGINETAGASITVGPITQNTTYTVKFTDACARTYTKEVLVTAETVLNTAGTTVRCGRDVANISASSNYSKAVYTWTGPNISTPLTGSSIQVDPPKEYATHWYKVEMTDGCGITHTRDVPVNVIPPLEVTVNPTPVCPNNPYTISATGTGWVSWWTEFPPSDINPTARSVDAVAGNTDIYWHIWSGGNANGCPDFNTGVTVDVAEPATVNINGVTLGNQEQINICPWTPYTISSTGTEYTSWWADLGNGVIFDQPNVNPEGVIGDSPVTYHLWSGTNQCGAFYTSYTINSICPREGAVQETAAMTLKLIQEENSILINNSSDTKTDIQLVNMHGTVLKAVSGATAPVQMETSDLAKGIYVLTAQNGIDVISEKIIIK